MTLNKIFLAATVSDAEVDERAGETKTHTHNIQITTPVRSSSLLDTHFTESGSSFLRSNRQNIEGISGRQHTHTVIFASNASNNDPLLADPLSLWMAKKTMPPLQYSLEPRYSSKGKRRCPLCMASTILLQNNLVTAAAFLLLLSEYFPRKHRN